MLSVAFVVDVWDHSSVRALAVTLSILAAVTALPRTQEPQPPRVPTIAIDPGHGGEDTGVLGASGIQEKQLALDVALRLRTLIETQFSIRVVLTREDDRLVALDDRAGVANGSKADLFLSLHANAAPNASMAGAQVYYSALPPTESAPPAPSPATIALIPWDGAHARYFDVSARVAGLVQGELEKLVPMSPNPIRHMPLRLFSGADMPAVLVEMAFLTNPEQDMAAGTHDFKDRVALALAEAVGRFRSYLETQPIP
jgi:N-acetylmuramoyl-L-alanine amidase